MVGIYVCCYNNKLSENMCFAKFKRTISSQLYVGIFGGEKLQDNI